jgi:glycosyltransferase involved in cell wall biosynthesis
MKPFISVIIPLFNKENHILRTLDSVLNQEFCDFEILVVDDGSTDSSNEVVRNFDDKRIRLINKSNGGVSSARNLGILKSKGEYLFFLDADDVILMNSFLTFSNLICTYPSEMIFATNFAISENNVENAYCRKMKQGVVKSPYKDIFSLNIFLRTGNFLFHRSLINENFMFNESISISEDLDFIYRLIEGKSLAYSPIVTFVYNRDNAELSKIRINNNKHYISIVKLNGTFYKKMGLSKYIISFYGGLCSSLYYRNPINRNETLFLLIAYILMKSLQLENKVRRLIKKAFHNSYLSVSYFVVVSNLFNKR